MDIKITDKSLRYFLETPEDSESLARDVSLCGPTFDRITKLKGDYLYEIEVITNRIDSASAMGIARDCMAILNQMGIKSKINNDLYKEKIILHEGLPKTFTFNIPGKSLAPRFTAVSLENIKITESPEDTKNLLTQCGERPINNVVDITNELTILYGMPSHIFDLDKLAAQSLTIRESKKGEEVVTLDDQNNILRGGDIIIEDGAGRIVDLCGIMGGAVAEVDGHTKNILLIVPAYNPNKIRKSSLYLQKRTLAAQIYEKQPDPELCLPVLIRAIKLFEERADARVSSAVYDNNPDKFIEKEITLDIAWANKLIGVEIDPVTVISILENLGFIIIKREEGNITCTIPSWRRNDINIREDLVEEIARVYGYSKLPAILPRVNLPPEKTNIILETEYKTKGYLSCQGYNEIYNSSLISLDLINKNKLQESNHIQLTNALSEEYKYLRTSLVPSILQNIVDNQGKSEEPFFIMEISNVYLKSPEKLPHEISNIVMASTTDYLHTKGTFEALLQYLNAKKLKFEPSDKHPVYFAKSLTAQIISGDLSLGFIGTIDPNILHEMGITSNPVVIELNTDSLADSINNNYVYQPISTFPEVVEEMTIKTSDRIGNIIEMIRKTSDLINRISYINSFENNHSFKITFSSPSKNLTQSEVNEIKKAIQINFN